MAPQLDTLVKLRSGWQAVLAVLSRQAELCRTLAGLVPKDDLFWTEAGRNREVERVETAPING